MICLRCGYCCIIHNVAIIKPKVVKEKVFESLSELLYDDFEVKEMGECPYLSWESDKAICQIHGEPWYEETPCFRHGQIETFVTDKCRMGAYLQKKGVNVREYCLKLVEANKLGGKREKERNKKGGENV